MLIEKILEYLQLKLESNKFINAYKPLLILLEKILLSGVVNSQNFLLLTDKIFYIGDSISKITIDFIKNLQLYDPNIEKDLFEIFLQNNEMNTNEKYMGLPLSYKFLFFK